MKFSGITLAVPAFVVLSGGVKPVAQPVSEWSENTFAFGRVTLKYLPLRIGWSTVLVENLARDSQLSHVVKKCPPTKLCPCVVAESEFLGEHFRNGSDLLRVSTGPAIMAVQAGDHGQRRLEGRLLSGGQSVRGRLPNVLLGPLRIARPQSSSHSRRRVIGKCQRESEHGRKRKKPPRASFPDEQRALRDANHGHNPPSPHDPRDPRQNSSGGQSGQNRQNDWPASKCECDQLSRQRARFPFGVAIRTLGWSDRRRIAVRFPAFCHDSIIGMCSFSFNRTVGPSVNRRGPIAGQGFRLRRTGDLSFSSELDLPMEQLCELR